MTSLPLAKFEPDWTCSSVDIALGNKTTLSRDH